MDKNINDVFTIERIIYKSYNNIYKVKYKDEMDKNYYVIKEIPRNIKTKEIPKKIKNLIEISNVLSKISDHFLKYIKFIKSSNYLYDYIMYEYIDGYNLKYIIDLNPNGINDDLMKKIIIFLSDILKYFKNNYIIHRDIKPENIMLSSKGKLIIIDFEFSEFIDHKCITTYAGTPYYSPIESLDLYFIKNQDLLYNIDCYSSIMTLYHLYHGVLPFNDIKETNDLKIFLRKKNFNLKINKNLKICYFLNNFILEGYLTQNYLDNFYL